MVLKTMQSFNALKKIRRYVASNTTVRLNRILRVTELPPEKMDLLEGLVDVALSLPLAELTTVFRAALAEAERATNNSGLCTNPPAFLHRFGWRKVSRSWSLVAESRP